MSEKEQKAETERAKRKRDKSKASSLCVWVVAQEPIFGYCRQRAGKKRTGGRERTANLPEESTTLNRLRRADTPMNKANKANTTTNKFADDNRSSTTPIIKQDKFHNSFALFIKLFPKRWRYSLACCCLRCSRTSLTKLLNHDRIQEKKGRPLNYMKASINKASNFLFPVLLNFPVGYFFRIRDSPFPPTYLLAWAYFSPDLFVSFCLVLQKPVAVQNTLLLCCCFYQCAADAATVRCPTVRRPFLFPSARAEMNSKLFTKAPGAWFFWLLLSLFSFLEWGEFWAPFFTGPQSRVYFLANGSRRGPLINIQSRPTLPCPSSSWAVRAFAREKMRRNKIRRWFNVINHG